MMGFFFFALVANHMKTSLSSGPDTVTSGSGLERSSHSKDVQHFLIFCTISNQANRLCVSSPVDPS